MAEGSALCNCPDPEYLPDPNEDLPEDHPMAEPRYTITTTVDGHQVGHAELDDPFVVHSVTVTWPDLLRGLLRRRLNVTVRITGGRDTVRRVMLLDVQPDFRQIQSQVLAAAADKLDALPASDDGRPEDERRFRDGLTRAATRLRDWAQCPVRLDGEYNPAATADGLPYCAKHDVWHVHSCEAYERALKEAQ